jgi:hypothetical protein
MPRSTSRRYSMRRARLHFLLCLFCCLTCLSRNRSFPLSLGFYILRQAVQRLPVIGWIGDPSFVHGWADGEGQGSVCSVEWSLKLIDPNRWKSSKLIITASILFTVLSQKAQYAPKVGTGTFIHPQHASEGDPRKQVTHPRPVSLRTVPTPLPPRQPRRSSKHGQQHADGTVPSKQSFLATDKGSQSLPWSQENAILDTGHSGFRPWAMGMGSGEQI